MDTDYERAIRTWLDRSDKAARDLSEQWRVLGDHVTAGGGGGRDASGIRVTKIHAAAPIRVEVVDLVSEISEAAGRYVALVRGTLRMGVEEGRRPTYVRLRFIGGCLGRLHAADPALCEEVVDAIWSLHRRATSVIDPPRHTLRPFRIDDPCPECGQAALWVDPGAWRIGCGMPACRGMWAVGEPVLKASSGEA